jgi:hypothetical protein
MNHSQEKNAALLSLIEEKNLTGALDLLESLDECETMPLHGLALPLLKLLPETVAGEFYHFNHYRDDLQDILTGSTVLPLDALHTDGAAPDFWNFPLCFCGDYVGNVVYESNRIYMSEKHSKDGTTFEIIGGYSYKSFGVYIPLVTVELLRLALQLEDYPVFDEEYWSAAQTKVEDEALADEWGLLGDFKRELLKGISQEQMTRYDEKIEAASLDVLRGYFYLLMSATNTEFIHETGNTVFVRVESLVSGVTDKNLSETFETADTTA